IFEDIVPSPKSIEYRNKMEFSFGDEYKNGPLSLGMHRRGRFYEVVTTYDCILGDQDFREILKATLEYCLGNNYPHFHRKRHIGLLRHFVVRKAENTGKILVNIVTSSQGEIDYKGFKDLILGLDLKGEVKGIIHTINDNMGDVVKAEKYNLIYGVEEINEIMSGLNFKISPFSFFQTNTSGAEKLYDVVSEYAGDIENKIIYDLYSGTGTIAQVMAKKAKKVYGIEILEEAVEKANENAELNNLKNCEFITGDVLEKIDELKHSHINPDVIILDPPRQGLHPKVIQKILRIQPERFVYVSCKPTSMRNDLPVFLENGYKVVKTRCVDMFPQTGHTETVVLLEKLQNVIQTEEES
ncbi:MAG: 23S rRNA (uracil(1939)-C(5))-methyltransferase RlmD, partial [Eubacteriales bacterium]